MKIAEVAGCCDFVTANSDDWSAAPDPGIYRSWANPEGAYKEARVAATTRSSVLAPGSLLCPPTGAPEPYDDINRGTSIDHCATPTDGRFGPAWPDRSAHVRWPKVPCATPVKSRCTEH